MSTLADLLADLIFLYGEKTGHATFARVKGLIERYRPTISKKVASHLSGQDAILITYGDQVQKPGEAPLQTLAKFCSSHLSGLVSGLHILPFYPYSSDDGFSVIDYRQVDPALGSWEDISALSRDFQLMFDAVINHISAQSAWFQGFLAGEERYQDYFLVIEGRPDLSKVVRPRTLPLLTCFTTPTGEKSLWTTFSSDQIDLNYQNPELLVDILDLLLFYFTQGAKFIRLDAIAYLWKEIGTTCIHLPQTHAVVRIMHSLLEQAAPQVRLITETNVPHSENMSYFGDGTNEAHLVYNFALPPLVLHTLQTGNTGPLSAWARGLKLSSRQVTFFNFLASHDGIGVTPLHGLLPENAIEELARRTEAQGGLVSYRSNPDGSQSPYELNINYFDALTNPGSNEPLDYQIARFCAAHAIQLALLGVPGIYFHSLFGSRGWPEGVRQSGRNRTINRQKLSQAELESDLNNPSSLRSRVFGRISQLLRARRAHDAFQPYGEQRVIDCDNHVFCLLRGASDANGQVLCLQNVSGQPAQVSLPRELYPDRRAVKDLISGDQLSLNWDQTLCLAPYQTLWLAL
jgi:glucosylglycerate phosphorylase